ncbi:MAG: nickel-responsive transcriptional regulator NikR [archaeon YNP-LCB-003-016]|uniref:nickel-responsive transcriptional regulator NikR n=1 Tax=Candidatus Culexarchaeum yellowstonense TaxID=2928963 RepID=UPI0026EC7528|nr:nickel-responsive transcriptional regulator NikR [Candidatus Culexarchaeum yellowstonense]MCC6018299.1 nickel-responsive transcriptional regulator NikR [Candidatus Verstraetearchaeota archaeon]MCR6691356.1 nickel-responsive transcriptional regulator NikR [Candidatus Culexarchaeum yellowstonense]
MTVISITIPNDLLKKFDEYMKTRGYYSRSEAFRDAIRNLMAEAEIAKMEGGRVITTIMITYDYERRDVDMKLSEVRHEFDDIIIENIHRHIDHKYCLEMFIAEGENDKILKLIGRIRGMRGIQQVKSIIITL